MDDLYHRYCDGDAPSLPTGALVAVASRWPEFLKVARAVLNAAGFHPDGLIFRDARNSTWHRGLAETAAVVCDSVTATKLPAGCRAITAKANGAASRRPRAAPDIGKRSAVLVIETS